MLATGQNVSHSAGVPFHHPRCSSRRQSRRLNRAAAGAAPQVGAPPQQQQQQQQQQQEQQEEGGPSLIPVRAPVLSAWLSCRLIR